MQGNQGKKKTFRWELIKITMTASILGMLILGVVLISISAFSFSGRASDEMEYYLDNISGQFAAKLQYLEDIIISLRHNLVVKRFFVENGYYEEEVNLELGYTTDLFSEKNLIDKKNPFIQRFYVFNHKGQFIRNYFYPYTKAKMEEMDQEYMDLYRRFLNMDQEYLYEEEEDVLNVCCRLYDENMSETGICIVAVSRTAFDMIYQDMAKYNDCLWLVTGRDQEILAQSPEGPAAAADFIKNSRERGGIGRIGQKKHMYRIEKAGLGLASLTAVPVGTIYQSVKSSIVLFVIIFFIILSAIAVAVFFITYRFTKPLLTVAENIRSFGRGDLKARLVNFELQEFDDISVVFNEMAERIHYLITQVYEKQILATRAQINYLQSQINPHFMFNILSMISMQAKMDGNDEVYHMLSAFSSLVQGKIFRREDMKIPLSEEMQLVDFYLYLQCKRYRDRLTYDIVFENEELEKVYIPRLCIEPLVENAVSHGLEPKEGEGKITVRIRKEERSLVITVTDDGVGFDPDGIDEKAKEGHTHVSLVNTKKLIQILYGEEYGVHVESSPGNGTCVTVRLPMEEKENVEGDAGGR